MWLSDIYGIFDRTRVKARKLAFTELITINFNLSIKPREVAIDVEEDFILFRLRSRGIVVRSRDLV
jgi:hypothetical protein